MSASLLIRTSRLTRRELYADELDEGISDDLREALNAVERAEARLEEGTYGLSVESGQPIPDDRPKPSRRPSGPSRSRNATSTGEAEL